ncbi:hypothetical protein F01_350009 [Burkholderia cenocepacia]|nr:hypothetical protein F01_350009 [Burkholderia cenocepacia]
MQRNLANRCQQVYKLNLSPVYL